MKVKLKCQYDNGKVVLQPGAETEMGRDQAMSLLNMGMVEIIQREETAHEAKPSSSTRRGSKKPPKEGNEAEEEPEASDDSEIPDPDTIVE